MKNFPVFALILLVVVPFLSCCKKKCQDPANMDCENYDPCYGRKPVSARFKIQDVIQRPTLPDGWGETPDSDTTTAYAVQFTALEEGADYEWHIGSEVLKGKSVTKTNFPINGTYPITLIVKKAPNKECFPNDDGRDTITRNMYAGNWFLVSPILGRFKGRVTNPDDTLTLEVRLEKANVGGIIDEYFAPYNWGCKNNDCSFAGNGQLYATFKKIFYGYAYAEKNCKSPIGVFEIRGKNNDTLVINYTELRIFNGTDYNDRIARQFVGVRQK